MISLQRIISGAASDLTKEEKMTLLKMLQYLANVDNNYSVIEDIGIQSIAAVLFPEQGEDISVIEKLDSYKGSIDIVDPEKRLLFLEIFCFIALSDDMIHPAEVAMICEYAIKWKITYEQIRSLASFDPIKLLELGLSGSGEELLVKLKAHLQ